MQVRRRDWDNFLRSYAPGGMRAVAESGKAKSITSFDDVVSGTLYRERSRSTLQEQIKNLTSEHRNRVSADENALAEQLSFLLEPCFDGLVKAPMARRLYNSTDTVKLRRFAELVRLCNSISHEQRTELDALIRELERSQKQSGPMMEFDAVLLNSRVAVVCESKGTLGLKELGDFHTRIDALLKRAADDDAYMVYRGMSVLPVVNGNLFREPESKLRNFADENGILLLQRNGVEYGPRIQSKEERNCSLYASLLRNPHSGAHVDGPTMRNATAGIPADSTALYSDSRALAKSPLSPPCRRVVACWGPVKHSSPMRVKLRHLHQPLCIINYQVISGAT